MKPKKEQKNLGGKPKLIPVETFEKVIEEYLNDCKAKKKTPFYIEIALLLGITKDTLSDYRKRPLYAPLLKKVEQRQELALSRKVADDNKPVGGIFLLKALHQYRDNEQTSININVDPQIALPARKR